MTTWVRACDAANIENEDVIHFDYQGKTYALFRSPEDEYFCADGYCTNEDVHLAEGLVMGHVIELPGHNEQFDYRTGEPARSPACETLKTCPVKVGDSVILINFDK